MKKYFIHTSYRGRYFDLTMCAKSRKDCVEILDKYDIHTSVGYLTGYCYFRKIDVSEFTEVITIKPYSHNCVSILGREEMTLQSAIEKIDQSINLNINPH